MGKRVRNKELRIRNEDALILPGRPHPVPKNFRDCPSPKNRRGGKSAKALYCKE
jgi:hypothetical protein